MLKALWFAFRVIIISAVTLWVVSNPGTIEMSWLGYNIEMHSSLFGLALAALVFLCLLFQRIVFFIKSIPVRLRLRSLEREKSYGAQAIILSLTAQAAGDIKGSNSYANDIRRYYGADHGLSLFFDAQTALLAGDYDKADALFTALLTKKNTAFLGLRGLMVVTMEKGQHERALMYAERARKLYPRQPWVIQILYHLQIKNQKWDEALLTLKKTKRLPWIVQDNRIADIQSLYLMKADLSSETTEDKEGEQYLKKAFKLNKSFVPAALRLARYYKLSNKNRAASRIVEQCWSLNPHPELAELWGQLAPRKKSTDSLQFVRWMDKLVNIRTDSHYGYVALAEAAMKDMLWGEARAALDKAEKLSKDAKIYRLLEKLSLAQGKEEEADNYREKSLTATAGMVWTCEDTGLIYDKWGPIARPHNSFNTIKWGYPVRKPSSDYNPVLAPARDMMAILPKQAA
jgi:HemY protein